MALALEFDDLGMLGRRQGASNDVADPETRADVDGDVVGVTGHHPDRDTASAQLGDDAGGLGPDRVDHADPPDEQSVDGDVHDRGAPRQGIGIAAGLVVDGDTMQLHPASSANEHVAVVDGGANALAGLRLELLNRRGCRRRRPAGQERAVLGRVTDDGLAKDVLGSGF